MSLDLFTKGLSDATKLVSEGLAAGAAVATRGGDGSAVALLLHHEDAGPDRRREQHLDDEDVIALGFVRYL